MLNYQMVCLAGFSPDFLDHWHPSRPACDSFSEKNSSTSTCQSSTINGGFHQWGIPYPNSWMVFMEHAPSNGWLRDIEGYPAWIDMDWQPPYFLCIGKYSTSSRNALECHPNPSILIVFTVSRQSGRVSTHFQDQSMSVQAPLWRTSHWHSRQASQRWWKTHGLNAMFFEPLDPKKTSSKGPNSRICKIQVHTIWTAKMKTERSVII